jgi:hypothetical protein
MAGDKIGTPKKQRGRQIRRDYPAASRSDLVVDGQDYYIEIADNVQLSVASTCQLGGSAGSVVTWRSDLIGWFDAPAHALRFGSF